MTGSVNNKHKSTRTRHHVVLFVLGSVLALVFFTLAADVTISRPSSFDLNIVSAVWAFRTPATTKIMKVITWLGNTSFTFTIALVITLVGLKLKKNSRLIIMMLVALIGASLFNGLLKDIFALSRPGIDVLISATGYSFPSGHAMTAAAFYGMLAYWLGNSLKSRPLRYLAAAFFGLLILAIGISRVYLGVHYPGDVLAGFAAGGLWLIVCIALSEKMNVKMRG